MRRDLYHTDHPEACAGCRERRLHTEAELKQHHGSATHHTPAEPDQPGESLEASADPRRPARQLKRSKKGCALRCASNSSPRPHQACPRSCRRIGSPAPSPGRQAPEAPLRSRRSHRSKPHAIKRWKFTCATAPAPADPESEAMRKKITTKMVDELKGQNTTPDDLSNQKLSKDPAERTRQLDYQAQQSEQFQEGGDLNG